MKTTSILMKRHPMTVIAFALLTMAAAVKPHRAPYPRVLTRQVSDYRSGGPMTVRDR